MKLIIAALFIVFSNVLAQSDFKVDSNWVKLDNNYSGETTIERYINVERVFCRGNICTVEDIVLFSPERQDKYAARNVINYHLTKGLYQIVAIQEYSLTKEKWNLSSNLGSLDSPLMTWSVLSENDPLRVEFDFLLKNKDLFLAN